MAGWCPNLVGDGEQPWRYLDAERARRLQVDDKGAYLLQLLTAASAQVFGRRGFMQYEYGLSGKWLELLKEIARPT
jgi:hypothetical protein